MLEYSPDFPRGAEWRQWDLHVHTPASFQWRGKPFKQMSGDELTSGIDNLIGTLNAAPPEVFALMDYWTFEGWFNLKKRLSQTGSPQLKKRVFPGIELRLVSPTSYRLNAHVIFSDDISDQDLRNFQSKLTVALIKEPLSEECLMRLVREKVGEDLLKSHGFERTTVLRDNAQAILAGSQIAEVLPESYQKAIESVPNNKAIGFMPWDTNDGLSDADWKTHYAYVIGLMKSSPIFETRRIELRDAFVGKPASGNKGWIKNFQFALDNTPRLAVSGSDAHSFADYGKFPDGKATWIKADPTFLGLLQAIKEPEKRSFIGDMPSKLTEVEENKTFFIDAIKITKSGESGVGGEWLSGCNLPLNPDLIAIIGNKGSGKSALADVIALLGNSRQKEHFSFLSPERFRKKPALLASSFLGEIFWRDGSKQPRLLSDDPPEGSVEMVRYIPQAHFETLCNEHISGRSQVFEHELRSVIFDHIGKSVRQEALDFDQLIEQQERGFRDQLNEYRNDLKKLNQEIEAIENQLQPELKLSLEELLKVKEKQVEEHNKITPAIGKKPAGQMPPEQKQASDDLEVISERLTENERKVNELLAEELSLAAKAKAIEAIHERVVLLSKQFKQFEDDTLTDFQRIGVPPSDVAHLLLNEQPLVSLSESLSQASKVNSESQKKWSEEKTKLLADQTSLNLRLNEPQLLYEKSLKARATWEAKLKELVGTSDSPDTLEGIKARIGQLDRLPSVLDEKRRKRLSLSSQIFDVLEAQCKARERLFKPVQDLIQNNELIRDEYKLQFQSALVGSSESLLSALFELIKQNIGELRGEEESHVMLKKIIEQFDLGQRDDVIRFIQELHNKLLSAARKFKDGSAGVSPLLRVKKNASALYDLLFGLPFLEPRYSLLFQDTQIEQLSPGQRGALLLIFYLLVDKGHNPIILDQPEENLDNETVVSLLVPVVTEAKKRRQIIMVTHNPNLAVVCDAEQIIHSQFDRNSNLRITYTSGSIENPDVNLHVVNVLEGTKPAFCNRRDKYHEDSTAGYTQPRNPVSPTS